LSCRQEREATKTRRDQRINMENAELWFGYHVGYEGKNVRPRKAEKTTRSSLCSGFGRGVLTKNYRATAAQETTGEQEDNAEKKQTLSGSKLSTSKAEIG
jgi:hypothetical protein